MNLPNYFLADLPPEATLSPTMLSEACDTLKRNRETYLAWRRTDQIIKVLGDVAGGWLDPENPIRQLALADGPAATGFSRATLQRGIEDFFTQLAPEKIRAFLAQELGEARRLDEFTFVPGEERARRLALAQGPEFLVHIAAGNIPNPTWMSIVLGLLTRSAQFVKCARGASFLPRLFAHSIYDTDRKLGACLEVAEWRGGTTALEEVLFAEANCITATGSDETLAAIRARVPARARFLGYGQRVSFAFVAGESLTKFAAKKLVAQAVDDVVAWNQLGCLSPHVVYLERGGELTPEHFAQLLAEELERREQIAPRGEVSSETAATIASRRAMYEVRAAHVPDTQLWQSKGSTAWTVICEGDPRFQASCLHRFVYVKVVADTENLLHSIEAVRGKVSTVGLVMPEHRLKATVEKLARWGVTRICPLGQMQNPPLGWRHDGRPALGDLVTWVDWEQE